MQKLNLFVEGQLVDFFEDESISLKRVVKDLSDPKKLFTDYSKTFDVPASRKNNRIFKHYYRSEITNGIDARSFLSAELRVNMQSFQAGNVEVRSVNMKDGKPESYSVVFYGKLTELSRKIGNDSLTSLNINDLNHRTLASDVLNRLKDEDGSVYGNDLIYPIVSRADRFILDSTKNAAEGIDDTKNIEWIDTTPLATPDYGIEKKDVFPALKVGRLIEEIENTYSIEFQGAMKSPSIENLYMALQKKGASEGDKVSKVVDGFNTGSSGVTGNGNSFTISNAQTSYGGTTATEKTIIVTTTTTSASWKANLVSSISGVIATSNNDAQFMQYSTSEAIETFEIVVEADASDTFSFTVEIDEETTYSQYGIPAAGVATVHTYNITDSMSEEFIVSQNMPEIRITDLLSELFKRFNIVAEVEGSIVKTYYYNHYMNQGAQKDLSSYIDKTSYKIEKPNQYGSLNFQSTRVDTQMAQAFEKVNNRAYGGLQYRLSDVQGNKLIGDEYKVSLKGSILPLENISGATNGLVYLNVGDDAQKEQDTKVTFFYTKTKTDLSLAYYNGTTVDEIPSYRMPSNIRYNGDAYYNSLAFSEEIDEHAVVTSRQGCSAFNIFYSAFVSQIFDENRRIHKYSANIPASVLSKIDLNDRVVISGRQYVIGSLDTNFSNMKTRLELISIEEGDLESYKLNCQTISNGTTTDKSVVYMNEFGEITHTVISAGATQQICSIGYLFRNELGDAITEDGAYLNATTEIPNTYITYSPSQLITGLNNGDSFSITATINADSGYQIDTVLPANTYTYSGTYTGGLMTDSVNFTGASSVSGAGVVYTAQLNATTNIPNTHISYSPQSALYNLSDGDPYTIIATVQPDSGYQIDSASPATSYTFTGNINGANASDSVTFTGSSSVITGGTTEYTVTMNVSSNTGGSIQIDGVTQNSKDFTGTAGTTFNTIIGVYLQAQGEYFTTYPTPAGGTQVVQANYGYNYSNPVYSGYSQDYHQLVTMTMVVTIPNSNITENITVNGAKATAPRVLWLETDKNVTSGDSQLTAEFLSFEVDGEPPTVSLISGSAFTTTNSFTYSNESGSVVIDWDSNSTASSRSIVARLVASADTTSDDLTLTQLAAPAATSGSINGSGMNPFNANDNVYTGSLTVTSNGRWQLTDDAVGVSFSENVGAVETNKTITVTWDGTTQSSAFKTISLLSSDGTVLDTYQIEFEGAGGGNSYDYFDVEDQTTSATDIVAFNSDYSVGDLVYTSINANIWEITGTGSQTTAPTENITSLATTTTTTTTTTTIAYYSHTLYYDSFDEFDACSGNTITVYTSTASNPVANSNTIFTNTSLSTYASSGYYSDGTETAYFNGSSMGAPSDCSGGGGV